MADAGAESEAALGPDSTITDSSGDVTADAGGDATVDAGAE